MSRSVTLTRPSCMSFGWTNLISSMSSSSLSSTAQTSPSKSLRVTKRNFCFAIFGCPQAPPIERQRVELAKLLSIEPADGTRQMRPGGLSDGRSATGIVLDDPPVAVEHDHPPSVADEHMEDLAAGIVFARGVVDRLDRAQEASRLIVPIGHAGRGRRHRNLLRRPAGAVRL